VEKTHVEQRGEVRVCVGPPRERHGNLDLMLLLQCRLSHVVVNAGDVSAQAEGDIGRVREGAFERGEHVGQGEQDGADAEV